MFSSQGLSLTPSPFHECFSITCLPSALSCPWGPKLSGLGLCLVWQKSLKEAGKGKEGSQGGRFRLGAWKAVLERMQHSRGSAKQQLSGHRFPGDTVSFVNPCLVVVHPFWSGSGLSPGNAVQTCPAFSTHGYNRPWMNLVGELITRGGNGILSSCRPATGRAGFSDVDPCCQS